MSEVPGKANTTFRDFNIDNVPASGAFEPPKVDVRDIFQTIGDELDALEMDTEEIEAAKIAAEAAAAEAEAAAANAATGYLSFLTTTEMNAYTTAENAQTAYNAQTDSYYRWDDANSEWDLVGPSTNRRLLVVEEDLDNQTTYRSLGYAGTPPTGASQLGNFVYVFNDTVQEEGYLEEVKVFGKNGGGTIYIRRFNAVSGAVSQLGNDLTLTIVDGLNTFDQTDIGVFELSAGDAIGIYGSNIIASAIGVSDTYGFRSMAGNVTSGTLGAINTAANIHFNMTIKSQYVTEARVSTIEEVLEDIEHITTHREATARPYTQVIGTLTPVVATPAGSDATITMIQKVVADGFLNRVHFVAVADGTLHIQRWSRSSTTLTAFPDKLVLNVTSGENHFDADEGDYDRFRVYSGDYLSVYSEGANHYAVVDAGGGPGFWSVAGPSRSYVDASINIGSHVQIGLEIDFFEVANIEGHRVMPGELLSDADRVISPDGGWSSCFFGGLSNSIGSTGTEFYYTGAYANIMFAQGLRAIKSGTLADGGLTTAGGTATVVAAVENNVGNVGSITGGGNTGYVRLTDRVVELAAIDYGISSVNNIQFPACVGRGQTTVFEIGPNSNWWQDFLELVEEQKLRAEEAGKPIKCLVYNLRTGSRDALLNLSTKAEFKVGVMALVNDASSYIRSVFGQIDRVHFILQQPSCYITGTDGLGLRDGEIAQGVLELCEEYSFLHCSGGDYPWDHNDNHMDATGFTMAGEREAEMYHDIIRLGRRPKTIMPLGAWFNGTTVTQRIWSVDPLQYDTTLLPSVTNKGLVVMVEGSLATLTGDATIDNAPSGAPSAYMRDLIFTLSSGAASSDEVQVRCAMDYLGSGIPLDEGASSNLRSTRSRTTTINGVSKTICHWAPHFKRTALYIA